MSNVVHDCGPALEGDDLKDLENALEDVIEGRNSKVWIPPVDAFLPWITRLVVFRAI